MATLIVHAVPRAKRTELAGTYGDAIRIRVAAPPGDGAANAELIRFLAERLGVPRSGIAITRGRTARRKAVEVAGLDAETIRQRLR